jgi:hypothetical protein
MECTPVLKRMSTRKLFGITEGRMACRLDHSLPCYWRFHTIGRVDAAQTLLRMLDVRILRIDLQMHLQIDS